MKNDKDEPIALFGFTAYVRQGQDGSHAAHRVCIQRRARLSVGVAAHGHPRPAPRRARRPHEQHARSVQARRQRVQLPRSRRPRVDRPGRHRLLAPGRQGRGQAVLGRGQRHPLRLRLHRALSRRVQALGQPEVHSRRKLRRHPHRRRDVRPADPAQRGAERHHPGFALHGLRHRHGGSEQRRGRRQLPLHVCGDRVVSQGAQPASARAGAVPARSRAVRGHRLSPRAVQRRAGDSRGATGGARWPRSLYRCERRVLGRVQPAHGRKPFPAGADARSGPDARTHRFALRRRHAEQDRGDHGVRSLCERHRAGDRRLVQRLRAQRAGRGLGAEVRALGAALQGLGPGPRAAGFERQEDPVRQRAARPLLCDDDESEDEGPGAAGLLRSRVSVRHGEGCDSTISRSRPSCARTCTSSTTKRAT